MPAPASTPHPPSGTVFFTLNSKTSVPYQRIYRGGTPRHTCRHRLSKLLRKLPDALSVAVRISLLKHGWVHAAQSRETWDDIVRTYCNIHDEKRPKDDRKTQHLEGRAYAVKFRDDEAASGV